VKLKVRRERGRRPQAEQFFTTIQEGRNFVFFIKMVRCNECSFTRRNQDWNVNVKVWISHPNCDNEEMTVCVISHPYPTMFRKGETCRIFAPGTLRFPPDKDYPLRRLHERKTIVTVLEEGPDAQGAVMVKQSFGDDIPVLYSVLRKI